MVDWKKDMKLSDLLARDKQDDATQEEHSVAADETPESGESAETPFWKRELKFGRRTESDEPVDEPEAFAPEGEKQSFFKRELSFRRGRDESDSDPDFDTPETNDERTPFWKRELSFGRSKGSDDWVDEPEESAEEAEKRSFFRRELSFGRKRDDAVEEADEAVEPSDGQPEPFAAAADEAEQGDRTPFWKREISFGRRRGDADEETPVEAVEPAHEQAQPFGPDQTPTGEAAEAQPFEVVDEETPVEAVEPPHEQTQPFAADHTQTETGDATETQPFEHAVEATPVDADKEPVDEQPEPVAAAEGDAEPAEDAPAEGAPFWKRELGFGRSDDPDFDAPDSDKRPFFKRDFSFRRAKDDTEFVEPTDEEESRPFFKRGFSFRRAKDADFGVHEETPERRPFWKRDLSFRRGSAPRQATPGRAKGGRKKQVVGLKVGASQIAAARIVNNGSPELLQLARQPIEQGIVVGGELRDPDALAEALREFFARHKLPNRNVRLGIGNNRIGVRSLEISGVHDPKQLENAIRFRAQEALPIPLDEAVLDYQVIDETVSPTGIRTYEVLLVVAYRELIDRFVAACHGAGVRLVGIDLEAFALLRALAPPQSESFPEDTALVAVSIGHDRSTFAVSNGTVCEFTRVLDWGGSSLNTAIARALDVTPSQAEPVKRTLSLGEGDEGAGTSNNEHTARAEEAVRLELQSFARELVSSLHFYQNQPGSLAIGTIILTGGTAHMPGLAAELQRLIGVKVRVGDPLRRLKTAKRVEEPDQVGSMAVAIGLGIED
jgi:type IV pilus assembly protein PilM